MGIKPDFVLARNQPRGPTPGSDARQILFGLMTANIPSINSLESMYLNLERPIMFGVLRKVQERLCKQDFPLIDQIYYSSHKEMIISPDSPCVVKVGHAHAGMGKIRIEDSTSWRDISTVLAIRFVPPYSLSPPSSHVPCSLMIFLFLLSTVLPFSLSPTSIFHSGVYSTAEKFIDVRLGFRIQKVGDNYRYMSKTFTGSGWKSHFGGSVLEDGPVTEQHIRWADACSEAFGGMDLLALDGLHGSDGKDYIIELNDTAIGFLPSKWQEDTNYVRDLVVQRLAEIYCSSAPSSTSPSSSSTSSTSSSSSGSVKTKTERRPIVHVQKQVGRKEEEEEEKGDPLPRVLLAGSVLSLATIAACYFIVKTYS
jgi:hypothetical protein